MLLAEIDFDQSLQNAIDDVTEFVPRLIGALLILFVGWIIARVLRRIAVAVLKKVGFDNVVDRSGLGAHIERAGYPDSGVLLAKFLYYAVLLMALQLAISAFGESALQDAIDGMIALLPKIAVALVIVVIAGAIANAVRTLVEPMLEAVAAKELLTNLAVGAIWVVGVFAALDQVGVAEDIISTLFTTVVGSLGLILVIKFGVGGIWAARDRFWPAVYDKLGESAPRSRSTARARKK